MFIVDSAVLVICKRQQTGLLQELKIQNLLQYSRESINVSTDIYVALMAKSDPGLNGFRVYSFVYRRLVELPR